MVSKPEENTGGCCPDGRRRRRRRAQSGPDRQTHAEPGWQEAGLPPLRFATYRAQPLHHTEPTLLPVYMRTAPVPHVTCTHVCTHMHTHGSMFQPPEHPPLEQAVTDYRVEHGENQGGNRAVTWCCGAPVTLCPLPPALGPPPLPCWSTWSALGQLRRDQSHQWGAGLSASRCHPQGCHLAGVTLSQGLGAG